MEMSEMQKSAALPQLVSIASHRLRISNIPPKESISNLKSIFATKFPHHVTVRKAPHWNYAFLHFQVLIYSIFYTSNHRIFILV